MREILFRGWRKNNRGWICGSLVKKIGGAYIISESITGCIADYTEHEVNPETVCQYTGLTDKDGRKIFEGDIVKKYEDFGMVMFGQYEIRSVENGCLFDKAIGWYIKIIRQFDRNQLFPRAELSFCKDFEVIGNIFENPELIGE